MTRAPFVLLLMLLAAAQRGQPRESTTCGTNIVSATVVATYCSHRVGDDDKLDLFILWRGQPGWFQRRGIGESGNRGSRTMGGSTNGHVSDYTTYNGVTIAFDADFDAGTVTIGDVRIRLDDVDAVLVDTVDQRAGQHIAGMEQIASTVKLGSDPNVALIERSPTLLRYLQCEISMPRPAMPQPPVITVCQKLAARENTDTSSSRPALLSFHPTRYANRRSRQRPGRARRLLVRRFLNVARVRAAF
jgi:hypothetical protein